MRILISACLLGACCRYDGKSKECPAALLRGRGVKVYTEDEIEIALLNKLEE